MICNPDFRLDHPHIPPVEGGLLQMWHAGAVFDMMLMDNSGANCRK